MSDRSFPVRSYQRIFTVDRRIYQIDGRRIPVLSGGVPLTWLGWAAGTEVTTLALAARSLLLALVLGVVAAVMAAGEGGWRAAGLAASVTVAGAMAIGVVLGVLDWPLRLVVLPVLVATLAGQVTPDGRPAHRYLLSWVAVRLRPERRSLDRPVDRDGRVELWGPWAWIASDEHGPVLRRGRVRGPAEVQFAEPVIVTSRHRSGRRYLAPPAASGRSGRRVGETADLVELGEGRVLEVRP